MWWIACAISPGLDVLSSGRPLCLSLYMSSAVSRLWQLVTPRGPSHYVLDPERLILTKCLSVCL